MGSDPGQPLLWAMSALIAVVLFSLNVIGEQALRQSTEAQKESLNYRANGWIAAYFSKIAFGFLAMASQWYLEAHGLDRLSRGLDRIRIWLS